MGSAFKVFVVGLALLFTCVVFFRFLSATRRARPTFSYSNYLQLLDQGRIQAATGFGGYERAEIQITLANTHEFIEVEVPTKDLPDLMKRMMDKGATVKFSPARRFEWPDFFLNIAPILLMFAMAFAIGIYVVLVRRQRVA